MLRLFIDSSGNSEQPQKKKNQKKKKLIKIKNKKKYIFSKKKDAAGVRTPKHTCSEVAKKKRKEIWSKSNWECILLTNR